ncbi:MAG: hypothetical protein J1E64_10945 [Acetatifactor sp.]|nr:hypothetical protein [Acetatifactor sp.]
MIRSIITAVKQALSGKAFILSVAGVFLLLFTVSIEDIFLLFHTENRLIESGYHHSLMMKALSSDGMTMALPILAAIPFTASMVDDVKSGFIKEYLPRTTVRGYIMGKITACVLTGGLVLVLGILTAYIVAALVFTPMEAAIGAGTELSACLRELLEKEILFFCSGAFWSMTGMLSAVLTGSRYMAYASPFVIYYVLIILHERYFEAMHLLYPKEWIAPSGYWKFGNIGVILFIAELTIIAALFFSIAAKRRLR